MENLENAEMLRILFSQKSLPIRQIPNFDYLKTAYVTNIAK